MKKNARNTRKNEENQLENFKSYLEQNFDPELLDEMARETGFVKRSSPIGAFNFLTCLMFNEQEQKDTSLLNMKFDFSEQHDCDISKVAIHKRFNNNAVEFMKAVLSHHMAYKFEPDSELTTKFNSISIKDSSKFRIPEALSEHYPSYKGIGKNQALMNLQYEYDLSTGDWKRFDITKATRNDQEDSKTTLDNIEENDLLLRDLGYVTMTYLKGVIEKNAYYANRLPTHINVYLKNEQKIKQLDWNTVDKKMRKRGVEQMELDVFLGKEQMLPTRLIIQTVPEKVYQERIKKVSKHAKSKGVQVSNEYKIKARYNLFITNTSQEQLSAQEIEKVYRLRWQIELVFKTWKSHVKIDKTKKVKKERFECHLIAKIIWIVLNWKLFQIANFMIKSKNIGNGCSIMKFFKQAVKFTSSLRTLVLNGGDVNNWVNYYFKPLVPHLLIEQKKGKKTHCQIYSELLLC